MSPSTITTAATNTTFLKSNTATQLLQILRILSTTSINLCVENSLATIQAHNLNATNRYSVNNLG